MFVQIYHVFFFFNKIYDDDDMTIREKPLEMFMFNSKKKYL